MTQASKNRLSSLSGFPVKDAMQGLATGNRSGKPAERCQEILTPPCIVDICNKLWGRIELDPCFHPDAITDPVYASIDGLKNPWPAKTYINPPYKDLKTWLGYGAVQRTEQIWLVPVRTHRKWWRAWRDQLDVYVEMNPLKFVGYKSYFPAPLLLGYRGNLELHFAELTQGLGSVYTKRVDDFDY